MSRVRTADPEDFDPTSLAGRTRIRSRGGRPQHGQCVTCQHRTTRRHHGAWSHTVCAAGPCPTCGAR